MVLETKWTIYTGWPFPPVFYYLTKVLKIFESTKLFLNFFIKK